MFAPFPPFHVHIAAAISAGPSEADHRTAASRSAQVQIRDPAAASEAANDLRLVALEVIDIFAAGIALQVVLLAFRVLTSHPLVVQIEPAPEKLALAKCGDRHDDPPKIDRS